MKMLKALLAACVASLLGACEGAPPLPSAPGPEPRVRGAAAPQTDVVEIPLSGTLFSPCTGEYVAVSGVARVVIHTTSDAAGGTYYLSHSTSPGFAAVGVTSGTSYSLAQATTVRFHVGASEGETTTNEVRLVARGPAPDLIVRTVLHTTIDANGNVRAEVVDLALYCAAPNAGAP